LRVLGPRRIVDARETDRVTRAAPDRFHVLLPETEGADAGVMSERVRDAFAGPNERRPTVALELRLAAVSPGSGETLYDALRLAQEEVA
jgi:hypothetical protein